MFTPTQLEQVAPSMVAAAAKDLKRAGDGEGKAHGHYRSRVLSPISGGVIWHDDPAKSDAVPVLAAAALAFDTVSTLMLAGTTALATLAVELDAAKRSAEKVITFARNMTFTVDMQRGEISYEPPPGSYPGPAAGGDGQHAQLNGMAMQCDALLKAALRRADRADTACGSLLSGLGYVNVPMTSSNYPGLAEAARHANTAAYTALGKAIQLLSQLRTAAKNDLDKVNAKDYTPLQHLYSFFKGMTVGPDPNSWSEGRPGEYIGFAASFLLAIGPLVKGVTAGARGALALGRAAKAAEEAGQAAKGAENAGQAAKGAENASKGGWDLPREGGGKYINGRWYTEHSLERMAPRTPEVMSVLERRCLERAERHGLTPGTRQFGEWWAKNGPDPRNVPPTVVEHEISHPGSTSVRVITNDKGDVVTVIPR